MNVTGGQNSREIRIFAFMSLGSKTNKVQSEEWRQGPLSSLRVGSSQSRLKFHRWLLFSSVVFVFELSAFVQLVVHNKNWLQFVSRALNLFVSAVFASNDSQEMPESLVVQWGDGALAFLFFLNLVLFRSAPLKSKVLMILLGLLVTTVVHAASIASYLALGLIPTSSFDQWIIAMPFLVILTFAMNRWAQRHP